MASPLFHLFLEFYKLYVTFQICRLLAYFSNYYRTMLTSSHAICKW